MKTVHIAVSTADCTADEAYERISDFERFPELVEEARSVTVHTNDNGVVTSDWEVFFRNGPLKWSEVDYFQPEQHRIVFEQTAGDFEVFRGHWQVDPLGSGCTVHFEVTFDFGIPSLAGVLEPIASKVLKEGMALALAQLLGDIRIVNDPALLAATAAKLDALAAARA